jgi:hypothetical protein
VSDKRVLAGHVDVDAGLIWIGDPCYVLGDDASSRVHSWSDFCEKIWAQGMGNSGESDFASPLGAGVGIVTHSGFGDGSYPVYVTTSDEGSWGVRVKKIEVVFIGEDEDE